jgi:hypothetical protein
MIANRMKFPAAMLALVLATLGLNAAAQTIGQVRFVSGSAEVVRGATRLPVVKDMALSQADRVLTAPDGHVQVSLTDGSFIAIRPATDFSVEQYVFDQRQPAVGRALMSLVRGTVRVFTGDMVRANRDNFRMKTPITTVGIRGSGNILAHDDTNGSINHTLTGAHAVTSKDASGAEQTLVSYPGQTIQSLPNQPPRFIPTPSFILAAASPGGKADDKDKAAKETETGSGESAEDGKTATQEKSEAPVAVAQATTSTVGSAIVAAQPQDTNYSASVRFADVLGTGFVGGLTSAIGQNGGAIIDASGRLVGLRNVTQFGLFITANGGTALPIITPTLPAGFSPTANSAGGTVTLSGGTHFDGFRTPDSSVIIGRWQGGSLSYSGGTDQQTGAATSPVTVSLGPRSMVYTVTTPTPLSVIASATGTVNYTLVAATAPTDVFGNVGSVTSASVAANFTNLTVTGQLGLTLGGLTFNINGSSPINAFEGGGFNFLNVPNQGTTLTCSGAACLTAGYRTTVNGLFNGADGRWVTLIYRINPNRTIAGSAYSDAINGSAVLGSGAALAPAFSLPRTGSVSLSFNNPASPGSFSNIGGNQVAVSHVVGSLQANFSNSTVAFTAAVSAQAGSFGNTVSGPTYNISASNVPINGTVFSAATGTNLPANVAAMTVTCAGTLCVQNPAGRFDGFFRNSAGTAGNANINVGQYFVQTTFGTPGTPVSPVSADAASAAVAQAAIAAAQNGLAPAQATRFFQPRASTTHLR